MYYFYTTEYCLISRKDRNYIFNKKTKGLVGKKVSYPKWQKAKLKLFKVKIPVGQRTPLHINPAAMIVYIAQWELKHTRG